MVLAWLAFGIPLYYGVLAVFMTFFLALVACRATGDTDITPIGAMGKIMQLTYGALIPQNYAANLMTASITSSASAEAADLLNDLKSGYLLGAHPRRQFVGAVPRHLHGAPIASVAGLLPARPRRDGPHGAAPGRPRSSRRRRRSSGRRSRSSFASASATCTRWRARASPIGLVVGALLAVVGASSFRGRETWLPSATGLGPRAAPAVRDVALVRARAPRWRGPTRASTPAQAERFVVPIASGLIAGESIVGVVVAALNNFVFRG